MKVLGLDIGSSSIGWFIREFNQIVKYGVIIFDSGMIKGSSGYSSPTKDRRENRLPRNLKRARKYRKWALLKLLIENRMVPLTIQELDRWRKYRKGEKKVFPENNKFKSWLTCDFSYQKGINYKNPYEIRTKGLDKKLTLHEFGRALYHIVQRRGYKDIGEKDNETKKQIERREQTGFEKALSQNRTVGEALLKHYLHENKRARNEYPYRDEYLNELETLSYAQGYDIKKVDGTYNNPFVKKLHKAIIWQRPLKSQKGNIGTCKLENSKKRCPVSHPLFEIFRSLSFINTIRIIENSEKVELSESIRKELLLFFLTKDKNFKFEEVRKRVDLLTQKKNRYNYPINKKGKYYSTISGMPFSKNLIGLFGDEVVEPLLELSRYDSNSNENYKLVNKYSIYDFWHFLVDFDFEFLKKFSIDNLGVDLKQNRKGENYHPIKSFENSLPDGYSNLSIKALRKIIPFLQEGFLYNDAVLLAKLPEHLGHNWERNKLQVYECLNNSKKKYKFKVLVARITNKLIEAYKSLEYKDRFALKDTSYKLSELDYNEIIKMCKKHFGKISWEDFEEKEKLLEEIKAEYQKFFEDEKRDYRKVEKLSEIFKNELADYGLEIKKLYHHSDLENIYGPTINYVNKETGQVFELLPSAIIPSIKNPMFNKSMSILRKLINELILKEYIDEETKIIIEIPRGHIEDNNEREAYISYTNERESKREKYRAFLEQYRDANNTSLNIEDKIPVFELWNEQIIKSKEESLSPDEILKLKDATERYDLWMEQKAQCMYTGRMISISQLFSNEIDIEHTIPRSLLPDNTMANKTVCFKSYNTDIKNNRIPFECPNYDKEFNGYGRIDMRLEKWKEKRDHYEDLYESRKRGRGKEDENAKNKRIRQKHFFKYKLDYWKDKIERFETIEVKEGWARRQLVDTQMTSKYAREFLRTKFQKVEVVSAAVNVAFRKMYGFQIGKNEKIRDKHTHHIIDASVLSMLPVNVSTRLKLVRQMYQRLEEGMGQLRINPSNFENFNAQKIISEIENNTLAVNYTKDTVTQQTHKNVRKRGKIQYLKRNGKYVVGEDKKKIPLISRGDSIRESLFKDTYIGKIREVKRDENGKPLRDDDKKLIFHEGKNEFSWVERKKLEDVLTKVEKIVDPEIKKIIEKEKLSAKDPQGNPIRRVRIKVKQGKEVKKRLNYKSKHEYKNHYYSVSGSIPYAILVSYFFKKEIKRKIILIPLHEVSKVFRKYRKFTAELYFRFFDIKIPEKSELKLLKKGQKVLVLNDDSEFSRRFDIRFQKDRLYELKQFEENRFLLKYHLSSLSISEIKSFVKSKKDEVLEKVENKLGIANVEEDKSILDNKQRIKDFDDRKYKFGLNDFRLTKLASFLTKDEVLKIKTNQLDIFKEKPARIEVEGNTPFIRVAVSNANFLFEGYDFNISMLGDLTFIDD